MFQRSLLSSSESSPRKRRWISGGWIALVLAGALLGAWRWWSVPVDHVEGALDETSTAIDFAAPTFEPPDRLRIPEEAVRSMRLVGELAKPAMESTRLLLTARLMYDPDELVHVNTRFPGEVIRIGVNPAADRPLRVGDRVEKGQRLAILWSKEIGEKKSDLVDALSQLAMHEAMYKALKALEKSGAVPQRAIDEMERLYESDLIQVERYRRTLRSWKVDEDELAEVEQEAQKFRARVTNPGTIEKQPLPPSRTDLTWAEIDIKSPLTGVILEKNLTVGDIVDTNDDLFKVADLSRLLVMANIYEDDIPALTSLPEEERVWQIRLPSHPNAPLISGKIELIGSVIDPNQHTAVVQGWIDNQEGTLRVGQFVEAMIALPPQPDVVEIPLTGLIDDGPRAYVLVAEDESLTTLQYREVSVVRRSRQTAWLRESGPLGLRAGERVLVRGVLELSSVLKQIGSFPSENR